MVELKIGEEIELWDAQGKDWQLVIVGIGLRQDAATANQADRYWQGQNCSSACSKAAGRPCPTGCDCLERQATNPFR